MPALKQRVRGCRPGLWRPADRGTLLSLPEPGLIEIVIVELLNLQDTLGLRLAIGDPFQVAEIPEIARPRE